MWPPNWGERLFMRVALPDVLTYYTWRTREMYPGREELARRANMRVCVPQSLLSVSAPFWRLAWHTHSRTRALTSHRSTARRTHARTSTSFPAAAGWRPIRCLRIRRVTARFDQLQDRNRDGAAHHARSGFALDKPGRSAIDQKIGDFYFACMDEKAIDARGTAPLKPDLDRIAALKNKKDLADLVALLMRQRDIRVLQFFLRARPQGFHAGDCRDGSGWARAARSRLLLQD